MNHKKMCPRTLLCAFLLPCALMLTVLAATGVYPFGEKSLLIIDMNNEYVDYLAQMNESLRTGGSLLRTWNMGMGLNMLALIAFYTASPFNLIVMLVPVACITEAIFAVTLLKIGLAGLLFALYTEYVMDRRGLFAVTFAVAYALCGYNIAYASNIMWLDGVAFLPLVLLGAEKILRENRSGVFLFGLVYVFFTSYYIGYMVGVFSFLYFTCVYFSEDRPFRDYLRKLGRFVLTAALAAGCCAFLLLPAFLQLRNGQAEMWNIAADWQLEKPLVRIASRLLPGVYDTLTDPGYPNLFCSVLAVLLCACFFLHRGFSRREKLVFGGLLGFLLLSFSCRLLDLGWHAFENPTWFPARYSFVFCFLVLYLAMRAAREANRLSVTAVLGAGGLLAALIVEIGIGRYRYVTMASLLAGGLLLLLYAALWGLGQRSRLRPLVPAAILVLVCGEMWGNALVMERRLDDQFQYKTRESYTAFQAKYQPVITTISNMDDSVYRLEILNQRNANDSMSLGFNGISHYSTTTDQNLNAFLRRLGYNKGTENELRFAASTPLTNGLLGIKYVLSEGEMGAAYRKIGDQNGVGIYENPCAFPLAFWSDCNEDAFTPFEQPDPFALQNELLRSLSLGDGFFTPVTDVEEILHNTDREDREDHIQYTQRVSSENAAVEFTVYNPSLLESYAYFPVWNSRFSPAEIYVNDALRQPDLRYRKNAVVSLGSGDVIRTTIEYKNATIRIKDHYFYHLDIDLARSAAEEARSHEMAFTRFDDTRVTGTVEAPRDGCLVTTFPLDSGWHIKVDGKAVKAIPLAGVFLAVPLSEGTHLIHMWYAPPGLLPGCVVSAACVLLVGLIHMRRKKNR